MGTACGRLGHDALAQAALIAGHRDFQGLVQELAGSFRTGVQWNSSASITVAAATPGFESRLVKWRTGQNETAK